MNRVPLFGLGVFKKSHNVTSQRRLNVYYEVVRQEDKTKLVAYGTAGLRLFNNTGSTPARGMYDKGDYIYMVTGARFIRVANDGTVTELGILLTNSGKVSISDNGNQIIIVDGQYGYIYNISGASFTQITDADFPATPQTVTFIAGFFVVTINNSGRYYVSALYDGTSWDALDYANAESNPDNLLRAYALGGQVVLFGDKSTEFASLSGAEDFPLLTVQGSGSDYGLVSRWAVSPFSGTLMFLARNRNGEMSVRYLNGYQSVDVTDPEMTKIINSASDVSQATSYSYTLDGHQMYVLNIGGETYMYDGQSQSWSQLKSNGINRHRAECQSVLVNKMVVSDFENGNLYYLDADYYSDNGEPIEREIVSRHIFDNQKNVFVSALMVDMETGVGNQTGQGVNPVIMLQVSKDNGHTYGNERWVPIGAIGTYLTRAIWRQLGFGNDFVFKIRMTDPVKFVVTGAYMDYARGI